MSAGLFSDPAFQVGTLAADLRRGRHEVRVLSLWQPWASLVAAGVKRNETRSWSTPWRGLVAIHAARTTLPLATIPRELAAILEVHAGRLPARFPVGAVVCLARVVDVTSTTASKGGLRARQLLEELTPEERACGNYDPNRYAWRLELVGTLAQPIPYRGSQGLRPAPRALLVALGEQLRPALSSFSTSSETPKQEPPHA